MDRLEVHERIIETEYFLHGGALDVPKVYDADGHYHTARNGKGMQGGMSGDIHSQGRVVGSISRTAHSEWLSSLVSHT